MGGGSLSVPTTDDALCLAAVWLSVLDPDSKKSGAPQINDSKIVDKFFNDSKMTHPYHG